METLINKNARGGELTWVKIICSMLFLSLLFFVDNAMAGDRVYVTRDLVCPPCSDSDGGMNPYTLGAVTLRNPLSTSINQDFCSSDSTLTEFSCNEDGGVEASLYPCVCENGTCIKAEPLVDDACPVTDNMCTDVGGQSLMVTSGNLFQKQSDFSNTQATAMMSAYNPELDSTSIPLQQNTQNTQNVNIQKTAVTERGPTGLTEAELNENAEEGLKILWYVLIICVVGICGYVVYRKIKGRKGQSDTDVSQETQETQETQEIPEKSQKKYKYKKELQDDAQEMPKVLPQEDEEEELDIMEDIEPSEDIEPKDDDDEKDDDDDEKKKLKITPEQLKELHEQMADMAKMQVKMQEQFSKLCS